MRRSCGPCSCIQCAYVCSACSCRCVGVCTCSCVSEFLCDFCVVCALSTWLYALTHTNIHASLVSLLFLSYIHILTGAFHTSFMEPAVEKLRTVLKTVDIKVSHSLTHSLHTHPQSHLLHTEWAELRSRSPCLLN